jgi:tetratricopeptide (TPR) repeat protein
MKRLVIVSLLLWPMAALPQTRVPAPEKPAVLMTGYGDLHHPVSTQNAEAQQFFDQGLRLIYAFNHEEAARSFRHAAELDPTLGMAWWGVALAVGPNYNLPVDPEHEKIAADAVSKAVALSVNAPQVEKDYIQAIAKRFSSNPNPDYHQLDIDYSNAMRELVHKYPDDLDAATLFADSMMNLRPWKLWNADGTPANGTPEIVATLESALRRDPNHIGAMHFYIHAVEASPAPQRALPYADRLAALTPAAGHLVHMPSHIYINTGDYNGARAANEDASKADERYIAATGAQGIYPLMYYSHNLHFLAIAAATQGRCADAQDAAKKLAANVRPATGEMPMLEAFEGIQLVMAVRCEQWNELLHMSPPDSHTPTLKAFWLYSRGSALAATGNLSEAEAMQAQLAAVVKQIPRDEIFMPPVENKTWQVLHIADDVLAARIAAAKGHKESAVKLLRDAVANQDELKYNEPPDWYYEVRESLGGMLLQTGDAKGAEQVFRDDLALHPRNPRSLFGLAEALKMQGRTYDASWVVTQFQTAWQGADVKLSVSTL